MCAKEQRVNTGSLPRWGKGPQLAELEGNGGLVTELNLVVKGWGNYFRLGSVSRAYRTVDGHLRNRLRRWLCHKHKVKGQGRNRFCDEYLYQTLGLFRLERFSTNLPWAKA